LKKRKGGKRRGNRTKHLILWGSVIAGIVVCIMFYLWHTHLKNELNDIDIFFQNNTISLTWKPSFKLDACRLYRYDEWTKEYLPCGEYTGQTMLLSGESITECMKLRLRAVNYIKIFGFGIAIPGYSRDLTIMPVDLGDLELNVLADPAGRLVHITWNAEMADTYEVYLFDEYGRRQVYEQLSGNEIMLDFNDRIPMPENDVPVKVAVRAVCHEKDYTLYGPMSDIAVIEREDLLEKELFLEWQQTSERQYVLTWQVCRGEWYEVQQWLQEEQRWQTKEIFHRTEDLCYQTGHLPSSRQIRFRVISYIDPDKRDQEEFETEPSEVTFHTDMSPLYCTIWPIIPLHLLDNPDSERSLGEVPAGEALCVLEERDGYFKVFYKECIGFVDSSYCMINLPEYIGDLCDYNITSSVHSMSSIHGYDIPGITGKVIKGYENICLGDGEYLVPYLYPCTEKLCRAIEYAAEDGYRFRIYDAFRPNEATRYYYDITESVIDQPIAGEQMDSEITLREMMTNNGKYRLSSFLAASISAHNKGIALDLTLVDLNTNEELKMQTYIHDLSAYAAIIQNNDNARLLAKYMKEAGYNDLFSEWWHFQDDETKEKIGLKSYLREGVSVEGWKKDDTGWRYQLKDGSFYEDTIEVINGKEYSFDAEGYCVEDL